ncbi:putative Cellulose 1, 4-beta-cellobiosidase [Seiridium unicorne]|uniref:Glucanase n=1 Tax=Seiridium unicorne TaxID=138068 RepID=A0ABR2V0W1_9PEZI
MLSLLIVAGLSSLASAQQVGTQKRLRRIPNFPGANANVEGWVPSTNDKNAGVGPMGACCAEIDVLESTSHSFALAPHPCTENTCHICETSNCGGTYSEDRFAGKCDANGCDCNPYRQKKFTVITQIQENKLTQFFDQYGKKIEIPAPTYDGLPDSSAITPDFCTNQFKVFGDKDRFSEVGGFPQLNKALPVPMVLVMSIWDDSSGVPPDVEANIPNAQIVWSNIRFGRIGATVKV